MRSMHYDLPRIRRGGRHSARHVPTPDTTVGLINEAGSNGGGPDVDDGEQTGHD